eukprot:CAMPEP_0201887934 /NCGR_PEP_ID=MMETSP0902-20130614/26220_1 /ASSEMBLY_ACC=CAM_ASM_000551 /TAXON_ID=420261 /ORGANISM="Thalassiosira antarctica, Strain CCMP982" /LENGTH=59 /DNA_ID=CAMNT_0048418015 /DNA_START=21 /DNA_END=197 /DNA_ORIENTATION=-
MSLPHPASLAHWALALGQLPSQHQNPPPSTAPDNRSSYHTPSLAKRAFREGDRPDTMAV